MTGELQRRAEEAEEEAELWLKADSPGGWIDNLRKDSDLLAWVLSHPETCAECLQDAAAGDGTARDNIEFRRDALTPWRMRGRPEERKNAAGP